MIIVLLVFCILLLFTGLWLIDRECDWTGTLSCTLGFVGLVTAIVVIICLCVCLTGATLADEKISMYEEENEKIELRISEAIKEYQKYESGVFEKVTPENAVTLVTVYPELKSDALMQKQIEVYLNNNEELKELKVMKIEEKIYRWWLYFGGGSNE